MLEFIQSYGIWIFVGLLFSLMLWGHTRGHGMGCCGGGHQHEHESTKGNDQGNHPNRDCH